MSLPPELAFVFGDVENVFHRTRLLSREMVAENTLALTVERPADFVFTPGQNTMVSIPSIHADDLKEFTIASAPYENNIVLAMRVRHSDFKNAVYALKPGDAITVRSPSGSLWEATAAPQVWLSGGIGITPFRSIVRELMHRHAPIDITHIHSDRALESIPFLQEFESYTALQIGFRFIATLTRESAQGRVSGRITANLITANARHYADSNYFVVGTDSFVQSMRGVLAELEIAAACIRTERFEGYKTNDA